VSRYVRYRVSAQKLLRSDHK